MTGAAYHLHGLLAFHFTPGSSPGGRLTRLLEFCRVPQPLPGSLEIETGFFRPGNYRLIRRGRYKFVPWRCAVLEDGGGPVAALLPGAGVSIVSLFPAGAPAAPLAAGG